MFKGNEVSIVFIRNHETLLKSNDTRFVLGSVLPSGHNIPRIKVSLRNTKSGAVSITHGNLLSCIQQFFHCKRHFSGIIINYLHVI